MSTPNDDAVCCGYLVVGKDRRTAKYGMLCCLIKSVGQELFDPISREHLLNHCIHPIQPMRECPYLKTLGRKGRSIVHEKVKAFYKPEIKPWKEE